MSHGIVQSAGHSNALLQDILDDGEVRTNASGNPILQDVGPWMKKEIKKSFKDADVKYIDPSCVRGPCASGEMPVRSISLRICK